MGNAAGYMDFDRAGTHEVVSTGVFFSWDPIKYTT